MIDILKKKKKNVTRIWTQIPFIYIYVVENYGYNYTFYSFKSYKFTLLSLLDLLQFTHTSWVKV